MQKVRKLILGGCGVSSISGRRDQHHLWQPVRTVPVPVGGPLPMATGWSVDLPAVPR